MIVSSLFLNLYFFLSDSSEFPETHLYDLIERAGNQTQWNIPYQKNESFGVLLAASTRFIERGDIDGNASMDQFIFTVLPDCIEKLTTTSAVTGWKDDVVTGVFEMLKMTVELIAAFALRRSIPLQLSQALVNIFDKNNKFFNHSHVRYQKVDKNFVQQRMNNTWITPPPPGTFSLNSSTREASGWLIDLIHYFSANSGFESLASRISHEYDFEQNASNLAPIAIVAEFLTPKFLTDLMSKRLTATYQRVYACDDTILKSSAVSQVFEILRYAHRIYKYMDSTQQEVVERCYFELLLRMVSLQSFAARMNALKQVLALFENTQKEMFSQGCAMFSKESIISWLNSSNFLTQALSSNLDHAQYCERLGKVLENMGSSISKAHLGSVCDRLRQTTNDQATENITNLLAQIIPKSGTEKLREFLVFLQEAWASSDEWSRAKILRLFDKIASSSRHLEVDFYQKIVECVWNLAMNESSSHNPSHDSMVAKIMNTHLQMIRDPGPLNRKEIWRYYSFRCMENIRKGVVIYLSAKHLLAIVKPQSQSYFPKDTRSILKDLEDRDLVKLLLHVIDRVVGCGDEVLITTGAPDEAQLVHVLLEILRQVSLNSDSYLSVDCIGSLWMSLVDRASVSPASRNHVFTWLLDVVKDITTETKSHFFRKFIMFSIRRLCELSSDEMIECFREYFIHCNIVGESIVQNLDKSYYVSKPGQLIGIDCAWYAVLTSRDENMASKWGQFVCDFLVNKLKPTLLQEADIGAIRLNVVYKCLQHLLSWVPENSIAANVKRYLALSEQYIAEIIREMAPHAHWLCQPEPEESGTAKFRAVNDEVARLQLSRCLEFISFFISNVDNRYVNTRLSPSHQLSFVGAPVTIHCSPTVEEYNSSAFDIHTHSNEIFSVVRSLVAKQLDTTPSSVEVRYADTGKVISAEKDNELLHRLNLGTSNVHLKVKKQIVSSFTRYSNQITSVKPAPVPKDESKLVGVSLSRISSFYRLLYTLLTERDRLLASTAMHVLQLLPTDPAMCTILSNLPSPLTTSSSGGPATPTLSSLSLGAASPSKSSSSRSFFCESSLDSHLSADTQPPLLLLYNLQALSATLMPVSNAMAPVATTTDSTSKEWIPSNPMTESQRRFCSIFINADGLKRLAELLYHQKLINSDDVTAKQESFRLVIRLMKHLLQFITDEAAIVEEQKTDDQVFSNSLGSKSNFRSLPVKIRSSSVSASSSLTGPVIAAQLESIQNQQMLDSLIRLCWTTASGKLHTASSSQLIAVSDSVSSGSDRSSPIGHPQPPSRLKTSRLNEQGLSTTDVELAKESLELFMLLLKTRPSLYDWFCSQSTAGEFINALLVACPSSTLRQLTRRELLHFIRAYPMVNSPKTKHPSLFFVEKLLNARVPFWSSSNVRRGPAQRLVNQCADYFELLSDLVLFISSNYSCLQPISFNPVKQIKHEIEWLDSFSTTTDDPFMRFQRLDDLLLAGHLSLLSAFFSFLTKSEEATDIGEQLIPRAFDSCLLLSKRFFSSSKIVGNLLSSAGPSGDSSGELVVAKCSGNRARQAILDLLVAIAEASSTNIQTIADRLTDAYSILPLEMVMDHFKLQVIPPKSSPSAFVGLKNAGATCYMNSVLQQLFMIPKLCDALLSVSVPSVSGADNRSLQLVFELQKIFANLQLSTQQFFIPEGFWRNFEFHAGNGVNVREHQDAFDFFTTLVDNVDEALKKTGQQPVLGPFFQGTFLDEKICEDCPHRFRADCPFFSVSLPVSSGSLEQSLQQYVKSERLDGENSYLCEVCNAKRAAVKRLSLKQLPAVLCIQLKRFYYDWDRGLPQKYDTHFTFPWNLDIEPFTEEGVTRHDHANLSMSMDNQNNSDASSSSTESSSNTVYQLTGIVVHSGQSNAGHYYSFIKDRRQDAVLNPNYGKWFNFNDTEVKEFPLDDSNIEHECFGGTYFAGEGQSQVHYNGERIRSWSAYLLYYERVETPSTTARFAKRTKMSDVPNSNFNSHLPPTTMEPSMSCRVAAQRLDSLAELSVLLQQRDGQGLFCGTVPRQLVQQITESNALSQWFVQLHDDTFSEFIQHFVNAVINRLTIREPKGPAIVTAIEATVEMLNTFLLSILLPAFPSAISEQRLIQFIQTYREFVESSQMTARCAVTWFGTQKALFYTKLFLVQHNAEIVRRTFREFVGNCISASCRYSDDLGGDLACYFSEILVALPGIDETNISCFPIEKSEQFFCLLSLYLTSCPAALTNALVEMNVFYKLLMYLGLLTKRQQPEKDGIVSMVHFDISEPLNAQSAGIYRQNGPPCDYLHRCLAACLLACDLSSTKTEETWKTPLSDLSKSHGSSVISLVDMKPVTLPLSVKPLLPFYLSEVICFSCEIDSGVLQCELLESAVVHCCSGSGEMSVVALQCLLTAVAKAPVEHLRPVLAILQTLLRCNDSLHGKRVQSALDGFSSKSQPKIAGLLDIINENRVIEGRRAYQAMKIICEVSTLSDTAKQLLAEREARWTDAVDWLNDVMSGNIPRNTSSALSPTSLALPFTKNASEM